MEFIIFILVYIIYIIKSYKQNKISSSSLKFSTILI